MLVIEVDTKERNPVCLIAIIASSGMTSPLLTSGIKDSNRWESFLSQFLDNQTRPLIRTALTADCARSSSRRSTANVSLQVGIISSRWS